MIHPVPKLPRDPKAEADPDAEGKQAMAEETALLAAEEKREAVTTARAARLLGKSQDTIYRWLAEGRLGGRKVGGRWLVYRDSVEAEWRVGLVEPQRD